MKKNLKYLFLTTILAQIFIFPTLLLAQNPNMMDIDLPVKNMMDENLPVNGHTGPVLFNNMLHAWVSLAAAIVIFILALKYMVGGKLARPIMLIGFGALSDAIIGLFFTSSSHLDYMWLGSLAFGFSVVLGIIWMANIFGVLQKQK